MGTLRLLPTALTLLVKRELVVLAQLTDLEFGIKSCIEIGHQATGLEVGVQIVVLVTLTEGTDLLIEVPPSSALGPLFDAVHLVATLLTLLILVHVLSPSTGVFVVHS